MFLCTNTSPGGKPMIWLAGTRESEQPIHRYSGACWCARREKYSASSESLRSTHFRLLLNRCESGLLSWLSELSMLSVLDMAFSADRFHAARAAGAPSRKRSG